MNRLPINLLLYVVILSLLGASGWQFYQAAVVEKKTTAQGEQDQQDNRKRFRQKHATGAEGAGKIAVGPNYAQPAEFWNALRDANFIGKEPPPPPPDPSEVQTPVEPVAVPQTPLEDIFVLIAVADLGADSRVMVRYKPEANVEPPPDVAPPATGGGMDVAAAPNRSGAQARPAMPTYSGGLGPVQILSFQPGDDLLWRPYEHIRLVRTLAEAAVFVREDPKVAKEEWKEETIYPEVLSLPQSVLRQLAEAGVGSRPDEARAEDTGGPVQQSGWQAVEETAQIDGRYNIGTRDRELFRTNPDRIFSEDIGTADWSSSRTSMRGVKITKLAPGYERYGVQEGEIVVAINGEPVSSKTQAIKIGKAQYRRGVRTFEIEFLTPLGGRITRSYVAPDEN